MIPVDIVYVTYSSEKWIDGYFRACSAQIMISIV